MSLIWFGHTGGMFNIRSGLGSQLCDGRSTCSSIPARGANPREATEDEATRLPGAHAGEFLTDERGQVEQVGGRIPSFGATVFLYH